ncbi:hypothetical protein PR202_gb18723 [Eleusine coracana subsp. coracana]|uniref:YdbS-like PH domain-containing protein n=1 Tax=Eleusine coracana subsp. coracana TaxID=191504 RepID=A0AAV5F6C4_ELECO|nr:hypothetical protein PR202_gb18723 [Eleusine coracana subsp. coracana]
MCPSPAVSQSQLVAGRGLPETREIGRCVATRSVISAEWYRQGSICSSEASVDAHGLRIQARSSKAHSLHEPEIIHHAAAAHRRRFLHPTADVTTVRILPPARSRHQRDQRQGSARLRRQIPQAASASVATRASASGARGGDGGAETVFFDGGAHYGDLAANLVLGLTLLWLPLTLAAVSRAFILRYRFTSRRVTVVSGLSGADRTDFPYSSVTSVVVVPRFIGEWGDIIITLKDGTKVDLRSVPRFREVADYCQHGRRRGLTRRPVTVRRGMCLTYLKRVSSCITLLCKSVICQWKDMLSSAFRLIKDS